MQGIEEGDRQRVLQAFFGTDSFVDLDQLRERLSRRYYRLSVDIDASPTRDWNDGKGFAPILFFNEGRFAGRFNGGGKVVRNLYINRPDEDEVGLFGAVRKTQNQLDGGIIAGIGLQNAVVVGAQSGGGDCGADTPTLPH